MNVKWYAADERVCGHIRGELPARKINAFSANVRMDVKREFWQSDLYHTDLVVFQRSSTPDTLAKIQAAKQAGCRVAYDIDDSFWDTPKEFSHPFMYYCNPQVQKMINDIITACDVVFCSTNTMAGAVAAHTGQVSTLTLPNLHDYDLWVASAPPPPSSMVTIGWMASGCHVIDAPIVARAINRLLDERPNVRLKTIGHPCSQWFGLHQQSGQVESVPWVDIDQLPETMKDIDIGLCPLADHPYNRCKSNIKALQHWSLGQPIVASPIDPYVETCEPGKDAIFAVTEQEWFDALISLVDNSDRRTSLGEAGRMKAFRKYNISLRWNLWEHLLREAARR